MGKPSRKRVVSSSLGIVNTDAAGIDIGATEVWVAIPEGRLEQSFRQFETFTDSFHELADWLVSAGITTVAMEATGVYWVSLFDIIGSRSIQVVLVDARKTKHVSGRKTDLLDCQWIQTLHMHGLLSSAYTPSAEEASLRTYERLRSQLVTELAQRTQRMQKALTQMNLHLHHVISDITGKSGMAIIRAMVAGERSPEKLASLCDRRIKASKETMVRALTGEYRDDLLFALASSLRQFDALHAELETVQKEIRNQIIRMYGGDPDQSPPPPSSVSKRKREEELRSQVTAMCNGIDPTIIEGIGPTTAITLLSEVGVDLSNWPTSKHFTSWCSLAPNNKISGGKILSARTTKNGQRNRVGQAFRQAAEGLIRSPTALGAFIRRQRARKGGAHALTAGARKIATLFYDLLRHGVVPRQLSQDHYEQKYKARRIKSLERNAEQLGLKLVPVAVG